MKMTSAQAAKLLRQLNNELRALQLREEKTSSFVAALEEDVASVRPAYDFAEMREAQAEVEQKIRTLKHAINVFNTTTIVPEFEMTIDEMLVFLPQLTRKCDVLSQMKDALPKVRDNAHMIRHSGIIEYRYANYDIDQASAAYATASDQLARAQTALDLINNTAQFEVDLEQ